MTHGEQVTLIEVKLAGAPDEWRVKVFRLIQRIPSGYLISYGELARWANREFGLRLIPRNTAWLRGRIYGVIGHDTEIPIHRIATQGDAESTKDQEYTKEVNRKKRTAEGTYPHPRWYRG